MLTSLSLLVLPLVAQGEPAPGFTLISSTSSNNTFLYDSNGQAVHTWFDTTAAGLSAYLLPNGNLLRPAVVAPPSLLLGGGGRVEEIEWDGTVVWSFDYLGDKLQHHDMEPMPNGNVLLTAWEKKTKAEAVQAGRAPSFVFGATFHPDHIIEVKPTGPTTGDIVWEWHAWDHLVQDFDPTKDNFGVVADHPELIDINFPPVTAGDWMHMNSVDYDPELDQILISSHNVDEIYIIDHSTTKAEAAGHTGGNQGMGGDILYRWGNSQAYDRGTSADQMLDGQHDANWVEPGYPGEGNITIFDNNWGSGGLFGGGFSRVREIVLPEDGTGGYTLDAGMAFGPTTPVWDYTAATPTDFYTSIMGGAIRLKNGNTLICSALQDWTFEVTSAGELVWQKFGLSSPFMARRYEHFIWTDGPDSISLAAGGTVELDLVAGSDHAGHSYLMLGSAGGTSPGITVDGVTMPLNPFDPYFLLSLSSPIISPFLSSLGPLGDATVSFTLPAGTNAGLAGLTLHHAYGVFDPIAGQVFFASNAEPMTLVP